MNALYTFLGLVLCLACLGAVIKQLKPSVFSAYSVACIVVSVGYLLNLLSPLFSFAKELTENSLMPQFFTLLYKAVGVSLICGVASEICKAMGEDSLAKGVESAGKGVILLLSLPVVRYLLDSALSLAS